MHCYNSVVISGQARKHPPRFTCCSQIGWAGKGHSCFSFCCECQLKKTLHVIHIWNLHILFCTVIMKLTPFEIDIKMIVVMNLACAIITHRKYGHGGVFPLCGLISVYT